mgnify:CR=1 FL=1
MSSLTSQLNSSYIAAANRLEGRGAALRIVAYVESYDDIFFWNQRLGEVEDEVCISKSCFPAAILSAAARRWRFPIAWDRR